jgi:triacylglycerol lipase
MRPWSAFLRGLNDDVTALERIRFVSIWTPMDLMIVPAKSCVLEPGSAMCVNVLAHPLMLKDKRVLGLVRSVLMEEG